MTDTVQNVDDAIEAFAQATEEPPEHLNMDLFFACLSMNLGYPSDLSLKHFMHRLRNSLARVFMH